MIQDLPSSARIWIYAATEPLQDEQLNSVSQRLQTCVSDWKSHGTPVLGRVALLRNAFVVIAADINESAVSGCGIDSMRKQVAGALHDAGTSLDEANSIFYLADDGTLKRSDRQAFVSLCSQGVISKDTIVFDTSVTSLAQLKDGKFEQPFECSWHARAFDLPA